MKTFAYLAFIAVGIGVVVCNIPRAQATNRPTPVDHGTYDAKLTTEEVAFNLGRVQRDPGGAIGWRQLASAYLAAGREHDSQTLAKKAQAAAEQSLKLRKSRNAGAAIILSNAYLEQHRFVEAEAACKEALRLEPGADAAERQMADIDFELGKYAEANKIIAAHTDLKDDPSGLTLLARKSELYGQVDEANSELQRAVDLAESDYEYSAPTVAWFHIKYGDFLARNGKLPAAEAQYQHGLKEYPNSWHGLAGMARLKAMQKEWDGVLTYGSELNKIAPMTDVVGLMEDAARAKGDNASADQYKTMLLKMNQSTIDAGLKPHTEAQMKAGHTHDRMFSTYLADHGLMLDLAQHAATHELAGRKDIYAYDNYAWVTFKWAQAKNSKPDMVEAKQAIDRALSTGVKDAKILYHAGVISLALGQKDEAKKDLQNALALDSSFGANQVEDAKAKLAGL